MSTSRLETSSDGVFAIAVTLLVLTIAEPSNYRRLTHDLASRWPSLAAYVVSFAIAFLSAYACLAFHGALAVYYALDPSPAGRRSERTCADPRPDAAAGRAPLDYPRLGLIVRTTFPVFCSVSTYPVASRICSNG
jgi:hypothetical protein